MRGGARWLIFDVVIFYTELLLSNLWDEFDEEEDVEDEEEDAESEGDDEDTPPPRHHVPEDVEAELDEDEAGDDHE